MLEVTAGVVERTAGCPAPQCRRPSLSFSRARGHLVPLLLNYRPSLLLRPHTPQGGSYVQGDCGAVENIASAHHYSRNVTYAAAVALNAGTDVDCGNGLPAQLELAIKMGLTTESQLDASLTRTYTLQVGMGGGGC